MFLSWFCYVYSTLHALVLLVLYFLNEYYYFSVSFTQTHPYNGPFSGTTRVSRYQKGKTNLDFTETRDSEWKWHQLDHMELCASLQTDNHASTPPVSFFCRPDALFVAQPTASEHWGHISVSSSGLLFKSKSSRPVCQVWTFGFCGAGCFQAKCSCHRTNGIKTLKDRYFYHLLDTE